MSSIHYPKKLLTPEQVSAIVGVTTGTLAVWRCTGLCQIPYVKIGRCVRYEAVAIDNYISSNTHFHTGK